ncbi:MAG: HAD-IC family P-type ATPase, partial [Spirochaetales bacterium]|nr:HAD-IC family P-type ATPase [Spirochaetales bacterium]
GDIITIGKASWMEEHELNLIAGPEGSTTVHVALGEVYKGAVVLSDAVRRDTPEALKGLKKSGIGSIIMLTGDSDTTARVVADQLGLDGYQADLLPHQKVEALEMSIVQGRNTAFMGDGINDAPVLARADVGIAMGGLGSDAAIEAADIVLMADEPSRLVNARRIARKTREIVVQNIVMALGIKAVILVLAAMGYAGMGLAVFGDVGVALLAVLNVLRIMSDRGSSAPIVPATHR